MNLSSRHLLAIILTAAPLVLCVNNDELVAQPKGSPITVAPQAPTINPPAPSGAQRGTSLEITLTGTNLVEPVSVWTNFPAKATIPSDMNNGKDPAKLRVKLEVPADVPIGFYSLRVATKYGISNSRVFCVDELPQVAEVDSNRSKPTAQPVSVPCVVMGKTDAEISDFFKVNVKAGQRLTFEVLGRRLGSGFDPIILIHDAKTGREMAGLYSDDAPGLQSDARLTNIFKEAGDYIVEIRDSTHRGGADFYYRLRIGDFPAAIAAIPVAIKRGTRAQINFAGPSVEGVAPIELTAPTDPLIPVVNVSAKGPNGISAWPVPVLLTDIDEIAEKEPNNEPTKANRLTVPGGVTGRFLEKSDVDYFVFAAKKGTKYVIAAATYEINSPAEVYLILKNAKNAELGKSVPTSPAARIDYTATEDGDLYIHAEHLNFAHGPNELYHLSVRAAEPDFDVNLGLERFDVAPGQTTIVPISSIVRRDYTGPIELSVIGHAGFSGAVTIPAGPVAPMPAPPPGEVIAYLPLTVRSDVPIGPYELHIQARGTANGKDVIRYASAADVVRQNMSGLAFPPREWLTVIGVGVTAKPLFSLTAKTPQTEVLRGTPVNLTISAARAMGFVDDIALAPVGLPPNVTIAIKPIGKGTNDIQVQLTAAANAPLKKFDLIFRGTSKPGGKDFAYYSTPAPLAIVLPFELKVEQSPVKIKPGAKAKIKVSAVRKGGFSGPIDLELKNLPANVTAVKTPIPMGKNEVEIELTVAPTAVAGDKTDVNATGVAAGTTAASPNFTLSVEKVDKK